MYYKIVNPADSVAVRWELALCAQKLEGIEC